MRQKCDMKHVPHSGPTNVRRRRTKFDRRGDMALGIFGTF